MNELLKDGVQQLIHQALEARLREYLSQYQRLIVDGSGVLVCNHFLLKREIRTVIGPVSVRIPKVRLKDGEALTFRSTLVPPYV